MAAGVIDASLGSADSFSSPKKLVSSLVQETQVSIFGTFDATATVQFSRDGLSWRDVETFTAATEQIYTTKGPIQIRVGVKAGDYTSGDVEVELA